MSIMNIGSLGNYMKNLQLQTQWQLKKQSGDFTSHKKSLQEWLEDTSSSSLAGMKEALNNSSNVDKDALYAKIQNGKKLTAAEKDYLRKTDPVMYEKVKSIEREREAYEEEIKRCKTKEEVQRVKTAHVNASLSVVKSVENNPNISDAQKLAYAMIEQAKIKAIAEITAKFVKSGEYGELPTDAEYAEAIKEMEQAVKPEEEQEKTDSAEESTGKDIIQEIQKSVSEKDEEIAEEILDTDIEIESEEVRKAKRAKAKAAYQHFSGEGEVGTEFVFFDTKG